MSKMPDLPGPNTGIFGVPGALEFQKDMLGFLSKTVHEYQEDIVHWKFGPQYDIYLITHPDYAHELLVKQWRKIKKWDRMAHVFGKIAGPTNLLIAAGDEWKKVRKMTAPAFHTQRIKQYIEIMERHTKHMIAGWEDGAIIDIDAKMTEVTMGVIGEVLFGIPDIEKDAVEFNEALGILLEMLVFETTSLLPIPDWVPTPRNLKENKAMEYVHDFLLDFIRERRASGEDTGDVLSALLHVVDEDDGSGFTDNEVLDQIRILFTAGYETTSTMLTWTMYLLAKHSDIQEELFQEVNSIVKSDTPTLDDLEAMTYTDRVLKEAMRMYPPVWNLFTREVVEELELAGTTFPPGAIFFINPWTMHHDPRYWENPETFDPSRFDGEWKDKTHQYSYIPFGGGPRICIGSHLAEMEAEVILATLIKNFSFSLESLLDDVEIVSTVSIRPKGGMPLRIRKR